MNQSNEYHNDGAEITTLNERQRAMLKVEKREQQMGVVLQVLGVATMLAAIGVIFALLLIKPVGVHANSWQNRSAYVPINKYAPIINFEVAGTERKVR
jgi:hypothetical protein